MDKPNLYIVKLGGQVLDNEDSLQQFLSDFSQLPHPKLLVHGGGKTASRYLEKLGIKPKMIDGRRVTDKETLDVVTMVYAGLTNKNIVAQMQALGMNSLGLTGADLNIIRASKRVSDIDYGFAGDIENVNSKELKSLLENGIVPVLCSITHDKKGQLLNTNADTISSAIAASLFETYSVKLVFCFEQDGVIKDNSTMEFYSSLNRTQYLEGIDNGMLTGGILPKLSNSFDALNAGVEEVIICNFKNINTLNTESPLGTRIVL